MEKDGSVLKGQNKLVDEGAKLTEDKNTGQSSPARRLRRLKKSRNGWKQKTKEDKKKIKALKIKARDLDESRGAWKERAKQAETKLTELRDALAQRDAGETRQKIST